MSVELKVDDEALSGDGESRRVVGRETPGVDAVVARRSRQREVGQHRAGSAMRGLQPGGEGGFAVAAAEVFPGGNERGGIKVGGGESGVEGTQGAVGGAEAGGGDELVEAGALGAEAPGARAPGTERAGEGEDGEAGGHPAESESGTPGTEGAGEGEPGGEKDDVITGFGDAVVGYAHADGKGKEAGKRQGEGVEAANEAPGGGTFGGVEPGVEKERGEQAEDGEHENGQADPAVGKLGSEGDARAVEVEDGEVDASEGDEDEEDELAQGLGAVGEEAGGLSGREAETGEEEDGVEEAGDEEPEAGVGAVGDVEVEEAVAA